MERKGNFFISTVLMAFVVLCVVLMTACTAGADNVQKVDLYTSANENGYVSYLDEYTDDVIVFESSTNRIKLTVIGGTPARMEVFTQNSTLPTVLKYQGFAEDHQFSDSAVECTWNERYIFMNEQEYSDFIDAINENPRAEWTDYIADGELQLESWANYHGFSVSPQDRNTLIWDRSGLSSEEAPRLILENTGEQVTGISVQYATSEAHVPIVTNSDFGEATAYYNGLALDRDTLNSLQYWLNNGLAVA